MITLWFRHTHTWSLYSECVCLGILSTPEHPSCPVYSRLTQTFLNLSLALGSLSNTFVMVLCLLPSPPLPSPPLPSLPSPPLPSSTLPYPPLPPQVGREASLLTLALQCVPSSANVTVHDRNTLLFSVGRWYTCRYILWYQVLMYNTCISVCAFL